MNENIGIIKSVLDTDLYKLTMQQAVVELFPRHFVKYNFINRGKTQFPEGFDLILRQELKKMENLALTQEEALFLRLNCEFLKPTYIDFLKSYRYDSSEIGITQDGGNLTITISGYWYRTILWEVPLMALISELYFKMTGEPIKSREERQKNNIEKGKKFHENSMKMADFGTRRRYSYENQVEVAKDLKSCFNNGTPFLVGSSNVRIAMDLNLRPIGTHAHEWFMFHAVEYGYTRANYRALENWVNVYQGDLGIALSDTFTTDVFFRSFDKKFAKLFDGVRHDSGDPYEFSEKVVAHYKKLGIDPMSKTIVFSDGLDTELAVQLHLHCRKLGIKCSFGIGTNLTNDVGVKPLNIVVKIVQVKVDDLWIDTVKLSDNPVKHTGTEDEIKLCKDTLRIKHIKKVAQV
ncbi:MAG: nicotinate phosphoribosyltransferase [Nanoarchaeota archaeon]